MNSLCCREATQRELKTKNGHFPSKRAHISNKICYKVSLCKTAAKLYSIRWQLSVQKWLVGNVPSARKLIETDSSLQKRQFPINIRPLRLTRINT